jgi:hypothetical protein
MAQVVSRRFHTAEIWVRSHLNLCDFVMENVTLGWVFSKHFGFLANSHSTKCSILIYQPALVQ